MKETVIGIDLGTQGVRVVAIDPEGSLLASASQDLPLYDRRLPPGWHEQDPEEWWRAVVRSLREALSRLPGQVLISGLAVDSTSGTILPVDHRGKPLHTALMYNDTRSQELVAEVREAGSDHEARFGYAFSSSFALPKMLWLRREKPEIIDQTQFFVHAADFIVGRLSGNYGRSDLSNALKSGCDLMEGTWPAFIEDDLGLPLDKMPALFMPGDPVGQVNPPGSDETGLPPGTPIFAGSTDGVASQVASGAVDPGDWNSSLGTTLVLKGISAELILDEGRRIYCHRHPSGGWMPGGASNTGGEWIETAFAARDLQALDRDALGRVPSSLVRYPLARQGERFPFIEPTARGFLVGVSSGEAETYAAGLEGVALLERLAYEVLANLGADVGDRIYATGGGARSAVWLMLRASILGKVMVRPRISETAMGAAILAASGVWYEDLRTAVRELVQIDKLVEPEKQYQAAYEGKYDRFHQELERRGYLKSARAEDHLE